MFKEIIGGELVIAEDSVAFRGMEQRALSPRAQSSEGS
jgi:hypothetical protein